MSMLMCGGGAEPMLGLGEEGWGKVYWFDEKHTLGEWLSEEKNKKMKKSFWRNFIFFLLSFKWMRKAKRKYWKKEPFFIRHH